MQPCPSDRCGELCAHLRRPEVLGNRRYAHAVSLRQLGSEDVETVTAPGDCTRLAARAASERAKATPMPDEAPVMRMVWSGKSSTGMGGSKVPG
jgi:hypothetical protein